MGVMTPEEEKLQRLSDNVYDAIAKFDITRRQAYLRINATPPAEFIPGDAIATRSAGLLYVTLATNCKECASKYARLSLKQYMVWFMRIPYECEHRQAVTNMGVEVEEEEAG